MPGPGAEIMAVGQPTGGITMTTHLGREPELLVRYTAVNPFGYIVGIVLRSVLIAAVS